MDFDDDNSNDASLGQHLRALRRRWRLGGIAFVAVLTIGAVIVALLPERYRSGATILIEQQEIPQDFVRSMITSFADQRIQLISQQVMTTTNLLDIINRYELYVEERRKEPREVIIERMRENIGMNMISAEVVDPRSGRPMEATIAFKVSFTDHSAQTALRVANELTTLYLNKNIEQRAAKAAETAAFLEEEASRINDEITRYSAELAAFKAENADALPELAQYNLSMRERADAELLEVERQIRAIDERKISLEAQLATLNPYSDLYTNTGQRILSSADRIKALRSEIAALTGVYGEKHPGLVRRQRELDSLLETTGAGAFENVDVLVRQRIVRENELAELQETYEADHPSVTRLVNQLAALDAQISKARRQVPEEHSFETRAPENPAYIQLQTQLAMAVSEQDGLVERARELDLRIGRLDARLAQTPLIERRYRQLTQDIESARMEYAELRAKERDARISENLEQDRQGERFTLIEPPLPAQRPISPNRPVLMIVVAFTSLVAALGLIVMAELIDTSVRDRHGLEALIGASALGTVPRVVTAAETRRRRRLWVIAAFGFLLSIAAALVAVHLFYRPLDVLWFVALRKLGI